MIVTDQTFDSAVNDNDLILIDFWAEWCGPCKMVSPVLDDISESTGLLVGKLNIDENPEKTQEYSVQSIPTMVLFREWKASPHSARRNAQAQTSKGVGGMAELGFDEWMSYGIKKGWCGPPVCHTHDGLPMSEQEDVEFGEGQDPCIHVVRMYDDIDMKKK